MWKAIVLATLFVMLSNIFIFSNVLIASDDGKNSSSDDSKKDPISNDKKTDISISLSGIGIGAVIPGSAVSGDPVLQSSFNKPLFSLSFTAGAEIVKLGKQKDSFGLVLIAHTKMFFPQYSNTGSVFWVFPEIDAGINLLPKQNGRAVLVPHIGLGLFAEFPFDPSVYYSFSAKPERNNIGIVFSIGANLYLELTTTTGLFFRVEYSFIWPTKNIKGFASIIIGFDFTGRGSEFLPSK